jgi:hypothetical protein
VDRDCTLNLDDLIEPADDLLDLEAPFDDEEVCNAFQHVKLPGQTASPRDSTSMLGYGEARLHGRLQAVV